MSSKLPLYDQVSVFARSGGSRIAGKVLLGASVLSGILSVYSYLQAMGAEKEIEFRKSQLKLPVYKLTEEQMVNPPWNHDNIDAWLYRRVEVVGRPIHRLECIIPARRFNQPGYMEVLPLVTREDANHQNRQGLILNMGWIPESIKHVTSRVRIEQVDRQKFTCFVSRLDELSNHSWFKGNAYQQGRRFYTSADMEDLGKSSELNNRQQASVALLERLHETGNYDERNSVRFGVDSQFTEEYPWAKTESGALQLYKMPWDYRNESKRYLLASLFSFLVGASIF